MAIRNPNSLDTISKQNKNGIADLKRSFKYETKDPHNPYRIERYKRALGNVSLDKPSSLTGAPSDLIRQAANKHYHEHESEYHDLGLIQAHMDGAEINVKQLLTIGNEIEASSTEQPQPATQEPGPEE